MNRNRKSSSALQHKLLLKNSSSSNLLCKTKKYSEKSVKPIKSENKSNNYTTWETQKSHQNIMLERHYASNTEAVYSAFQRKVYVPPHLNSSQVYIHIVILESHKFTNPSAQGGRFSPPK